MKPKKSANKTIKSEANKSVVLRTEQNVNKQQIQSAERVCNRCKAHQSIVSVKGHKMCPFSTCDCAKCKSYLEKCRRTNEINKRRLLQKKNKDKSKVDNNSIVNSLKTKSKKNLINKKTPKKAMNGSTSSATLPVINISVKKKKTQKKSVASGGKQTTGKADSPPRLKLQQPIPPVVLDSNSATDIEDIEPETQSIPEKSPSLLCAQYLKKREALTRKLKETNLTEDELLACFKYSMIHNCLGDVEIALQNIVFAHQAISKGAVYLIQNPDVDSGHTSSISSAAQQTIQQSGGSGEPPLPLRAAPNFTCSTFNRNARPDNVPNYSPSFTPIRRQ